MELIDRLRERANSQSRRVFTEQYAGLYLYGKLPGSQALGFRTRVANASTPSVLDLIQRAKEHPLGEDVLLRVEKSDRNSFKSRISVGRATNNDLVLRHESVSKLHAHFYMRVDGGQERLMLCDVGSANGTLINGRTVGDQEEDAVDVSAGDRILFGEVECELLDASGVYSRLQQRMAASDF